MSSFPCPHCDAPVREKPKRCPVCREDLRVCGEYQIEALVGAGGMSVVYRGRAKTDRSVAVKVMQLARLEGWADMELFSRSFQVLRGLSYPGIPEVLGIEKDEKGNILVVQTFYGGGTLAERIQKGERPQSSKEVETFLVSALKILGYLHSRVPPVIHRDIKPQNIMFRSREDWTPHLVDFDTVAAPEKAERGMTIVVTPGYTAPEQLMGGSGPASDLYSLGVTMLAWITGQDASSLPRERGRFSLGSALDLYEYGLQKTLLGLVEPTLSKRLKSAEEALATLQKNPPPTPKPVIADLWSGIRRVWPFLRRAWPFLKWSPILLGLALLTLALNRPDYEVTSTEGARLPETEVLYRVDLSARVERLRFTWNEQDGLRLNVVADGGRIWRRIDARSGELVSEIETLPDLRRLVNLNPRTFPRRPQWIDIAPTEDGARFSLQDVTPNAPVWSTQITPLPQDALALYEANALAVARPGGPLDLWLFPDGKDGYCRLSPEPTSKELLLCAQSSQPSLRTDEEKPETLQAGGITALALGVSFDRVLPYYGVLVAEEDHRILYWRFEGSLTGAVNDLQLSLRGEGHTSSVRALAISDRNTLASGDDSGAVLLWKPRERASEKLVEVFEKKLMHGAPVTALEFRDEDLLASGGQDGSVILWDVKTGEKLASFSGQGAVTAVAVSEVGRLLAVAFEDGVEVRLLQKNLTTP